MASWFMEASIACLQLILLQHAFFLDKGMQRSSCVSILDVFLDHDVNQENSWVGFICLWSIPVLLKIIYKHVRRDVSFLSVFSWLSLIGSDSITPHHCDGFIEVAHLISHLHAAHSLCAGLLPHCVWDCCQMTYQIHNLETNLDKPDRKCHPISELAG